MPTITQKKRTLRRKYRDLRNGLLRQERTSFDVSIRQHLKESVELTHVEKIAAFWPFDGEPDLRPFIRGLLRKNIEVALPVVDPLEGDMKLRWITEPGKMKSNHYGILEPRTRTNVEFESLDMILVPLVAWNRKGERLGMGGGYYDKMFKGHPVGKRPWRVGIAYGLQECKTMPTHQWDQPLHGIVTENGWFTFKK